MSDATRDHAEALHGRFVSTAGEDAEHEERARAALREQLRLFLELSGRERVLDAGTGKGSLAFAIAPLVREVIAVDAVPELLGEGSRRAADFPNVTFLEGNAAHLDEPSGSFDLAATMRILHHVRRPELVVAELTRVTRFGGRVLIIDQIAPVDPLAALELDRFKRLRDPSYTRTLPDTDFRALLEMNGLVLQRSSFVQEQRELDSVTLGWYLGVKPTPPT